MDDFIIQPALHSAVGGLTLLVALAATVLTWVASRKKTMTTTTAAALILLQLLLLLQAAIGIKLLDQGMGVVQKSVHYLGGLGALGLLLLFSWLPRRSDASSARAAAWLTSASLAFIAMTFFIGQMFVKSQMSG